SSAIFDTKEAARIDDFSDLEGPIAERTRESRFVSSLGVPIVVDGGVWGAICVGTTEPEPLPAGTEARLRGFTDLVATSISNAQAHDDLEEIAGAQAALRRVATLVAEGASAERLFSAVAGEVANVIGAAGAEVDRYEADGTALMLATWREPNWKEADSVLYVGMRWTPDLGTLTAAIQETRQPARIDDYSEVAGVMGASSRAAGIGSACARRLSSAASCGARSASSHAATRPWLATPRHGCRALRNWSRPRLQMRRPTTTCATWRRSRRHCGALRRSSRAARDRPRSSK